MARAKVYMTLVSSPEVNAYSIPNVVGIPPMLDESTLLAMQQQMAQQAALSQVPEVVKRVGPFPAMVFYFSSCSAVHHPIPSSGCPTKCFRDHCCI